MVKNPLSILSDDGQRSSITSRLKRLSLYKAVSVHCSEFRHGGRSGPCKSNLGVFGDRRPNGILSASVPSN